LRNVGEEDAVVVVIGGKGGYVGRDGRTPDDATSAGPPGALPDSSRGALAPPPTDAA
jgi:hypothetical protein